MESQIAENNPDKTVKRRDVEIMAPAGDWASFQAAIQGGADSIYFGIEQLNMRARASNNFTMDDLPKISVLARDHGIKTYLTVNTVLYDHDLPLMKNIIDAVKEYQITAIIASDQAAISYAHKQGVEVHISTQANISNIEMVEFYSHFADVMVLARELSLGQVKRSSKELRNGILQGRQVSWYKLKFLPTVHCVWPYPESAISVCIRTTHRPIEGRACRIVAMLTELKMKRALSWQLTTSISCLPKTSARSIFSTKFWIQELLS